MARLPPDLRKRRTREHVIADLSVNYIERIILEAGHVVQELHPDYSFDLMMRTFDENGEVEPGSIFWQLKASESWIVGARGIAFDLDVRDYNLWRTEPLPVILALYDATRRRAYWLHVQGYFEEDRRRLPRTGAKTVRVFLPESARLGRSAIRTIHRRKREARASLLRIRRDD